jgi:acyl-CoA synthetase (AMP-forming)/AMP-acid ligase II
MKTAYDLVWLAAQRAPNRLALVDDRADRSLTYRDLITEVDRVAAGLQARGVEPGARVVTVLPNLWEHCLLLLALQRLAAVPALLNFRLGPEEVLELAALAGARGLVGLSGVSPPAGDTGLDFELVVDPADTGGQALASWYGDPATLPPLPTPDPEHESFLFYTSGTTGLPKAVVLPHRCNEPRVTWLGTGMGVRAGTGLRALGVSPLSHAIGFHGVFLATLAYGGTFYTLSAFDPEATIELIEKHELDYIFSLPTIFSALVKAPGYRPERLRSIRTAFWGGATIEPELLSRLGREWPDAGFGHVYGTTETMLGLVNPDPGESHDVLEVPYGCNVRIVREDGSGDECNDGEEGELLIDATADSVFSGYLDRPEATADKLRDGWYHTGDAAVRDEDGRYRVLGRSDDMIRSGGEYIQPEEVERCLMAHEAVAECAVVGIPDAHWGQRTVACVVPSGPAAGIDVPQLDRHCRESRLANFKRPRAYLFVAALPLSAGNKLQRKKLREWAGEARDGGGDPDRRLVDVPRDAAPPATV